jgi:hypothetical protein
MRLMRLVVASAFCLCLLCGCKGEERGTDPKSSTVDTAAKMGTGSQGKIPKPGPPEAK